MKIWYDMIWWSPWTKQWTYGSPLTTIQSIFPRSAPFDSYAWRLGRVSPDFSGIKNGHSLLIHPPFSGTTPNFPTLSNLPWLNRHVSWWTFSHMFMPPARLAARWSWNASWPPSKTGSPRRPAINRHRKSQWEKPSEKGEAATKKVGDTFEKSSDMPWQYMTIPI